MSIIKTNNIQLGQSTTIDNNITVAVPAVPDGSFKISKGVPGDTSVDLISITENETKFANVPTSESIIINTNTTLIANREHAVDFTSPRNLTLPLNPSPYTKIKLYKVAGDTTGSVILRNGQTIMGLAENMNIDSDILSLDLMFNGSDWRVL